MIIVRKNVARIGKPWLVVEGDYKPVNVVSHGPDAKYRWVTQRQLSEHDTRDEAKRAAKEYTR
jgi:hypothetical protein